MGSVNVNYEEIPGIASQMSSKGSDISKLIADAYKNVDELKSTWGGVRYNTVVAEFNKIIPDINNMEALIISEIPRELGVVANNYALFEGVTVATVSEATKVNTQEITAADTSALGFDSDAAQASLDYVKKNFQNVQDKLVEYESQFNSLSWESDAASVFKSRLTTIMGSLKNSFSDVCSIFEKLIKQAQEESAQAESANHV